MNSENEQEMAPFTSSECLVLFVELLKSNATDVGNSYLRYDIQNSIWYENNDCHNFGHFRP